MFMALAVVLTLKVIDGSILSLFHNPKRGPLLIILNVYEFFCKLPVHVQGMSLRLIVVRFFEINPKKLFTNCFGISLLKSPSVGS